MQDDYMIEFLMAYQRFARGVTIHGTDRGIHNMYRFSTAHGLCAALANFVDIEVGVEGDYMALYGLMLHQMQSAIENLVGDQNQLYPFGGEVNYIAHSHDRTQHENPLRLKFVDDYLSELYTNNISIPPAQKMEKV